MNKELKKLCGLKKKEKIQKENTTTTIICENINQNEEYMNNTLLTFAAIFIILDSKDLRIRNNTFKLQYKKELFQKK